MEIPPRGGGKGVSWFGWLIRGDRGGGGEEERRGGGSYVCLCRRKA